MRAPVSARNRAGIVLAALLASSDIAWALAGAPAELLGAERSGNDPVSVVEALLGVVTIVAGATAWVRARRAGLRVAAVSRVLAVLLATPAFLFEGVPAPIVAITAGGVLLNLTALVLLLSRR